MPQQCHHLGGARLASTGFKKVHAVGRAVALLPPSALPACRRGGGCGGGRRRRCQRGVGSCGGAAGKPWLYVLSLVLFLWGSGGAAFRAVRRVEDGGWVRCVFVCVDGWGEGSDGAVGEEEVPSGMGGGRRKGRGREVARIVAVRAGGRRHAALGDVSLTCIHPAPWTICRDSSYLYLLLPPLQ